MEKISIGINLTIVGLGTVFLVLFLLQMTMTLETWIFSNWLNKPQKENPGSTNNTTKTAVSSTTNPTSNPVAITTPPPATTNNPEPSIIAAIMGAIACQLGQPTHQLRLISIRNTEDRATATSWTLAGRLNNINTRINHYHKGVTK